MYGELFLGSWMIFAGSMADGTFPISSAATQAHAIGSELGINVEAQRNLRQQPVLIARRGAKPMDLLQGIAFALHATITREGPVYRITRSKTDEDKLKTLDRKLMSTAINSRIAQWDAELKRASAFGSQASQVAHYIQTDAAAITEASVNPTEPMHRGIDPDLLSPAGRLLRKLVDRIGSAALSEVEAGEMRVYSEKPTPCEIGIPNAEEAVGDFAKDQVVFALDPKLHVSEADRRNSLDEFVLPRSGVGVESPRCVLTADRRQNILNLGLKTKFSMPRDNKSLVHGYLQTPHATM